MHKGFIEFIKEQGVVGLAIGFILGGAVSKVVTALVDDIINPLLNLMLGRVESLKDATLSIASAKVQWGDFVAVTVDFLVIALVVYAGFKVLKLDKLQKEKKD